MKLNFKCIPIIFFVLLFEVFLPVNAESYTEVNPFQNFKQILSETQQVLTFETKKANAIYPSSIINKAGMNFPGNRGPGQLVVYYPEYSNTTGTNEYGMEAVVEDNMVVRLTGANSIIPKNGFVISGHGTSKNWIKNTLKIGTFIMIEGNTIIAYTTPDSLVYEAKEKIKEAEIFIDNSKKSVARDETDKKAEFYLKKSKSECKKAERARESGIKKEYAESSIKLSKLAIKFALPYIKEEFKGVWLRPVERDVFEIRKTLDEVRKAGIREIFLETYFHGYTIYPSLVMKEYGFTVQNPKFLMYDPLKVYVEEAHKRNMKVHCWFESFYVGNKLPKADYQSILAVHPNWGNKNFANYNSENYVSHPVEHNGYFLDPANPEVTDFLIDLIEEISTKYNIDGINLDYTRYPSAQKSDVPNYKQSNWGYTEAARKEFMALYEIDPIDIEPNSVFWRKWVDYRANKVSEFVYRVKRTVEKNNKILLTAVIFPDYEAAIETKQQNWVRWSRENSIDAVTPLILTSDNELMTRTLKTTKARLSNKTRVLTGLFVGFMDGEPEDLLRQISVSRALKTDGVVLFDWAHLPMKYRNALRYRVFLPKKAAVQ